MISNMYEIIQERDQYKSERDTLIDDIAVLKANISRLERENRDLRLQTDTYFEQWQNEKLTSQGLREQCKEYAQDNSKYINLLTEISHHIGSNPSSSTYKKFRKQLDDIGITESE